MGAVAKRNILGTSYSDLTLNKFGDFVRGKVVKGEVFDLKSDVGFVQLFKSGNITTEHWSSGGFATARAISKIGQVMSRGGELEGVRILFRETVDLALSEPKTLYDRGVLKFDTFTMGGFGVYASDQEKGYLGDIFGWGG